MSALYFLGYRNLSGVYLRSNTATTRTIRGHAVQLQSSASDHQARHDRQMNTQTDSDPNNYRNLPIQAVALEIDNAVNSSRFLFEAQSGFQG
jgi:hypothetical protein